MMKRGLHPMMKLEPHIQPAVQKLILDFAHNNNDALFNVPTILFPTKNNYDVQPGPTKRSGRTTTMSAKFNDYVSVEPSTYYEALKYRNWVDAINAEIEALNRNNTWIVTDLPIGRKPIGSKWIFKIKYKASGEIKRYKARCSINIDVQNDWPLYQLDVNNAFLYSDLSKDVYMTMPLGFNGKDGRSGTSFVALLVYVDDIVIAGSDVKKIERFKSFMKIRSNPPYPDPQLRLNIGVWLLLLVKLSGYAILLVQMFCGNILAL
ncbi:ribonuclease H-like domain-containing protein [Tanacetum coccineum]